MELPIGSIILFDGSLLPFGWYDCNGTTHNGIVTPNLVGAFPKGVPAGGSLGMTGGALTHSHTNQDTAAETHGHGAKSAASGSPSGGDISGIKNATGSNPVVGSHTHTITINAVSNQASHAHTVPTTEPASSLPPNITLRYIMRCE